MLTPPQLTTKPPGPNPPMIESPLELVKLLAPGEKGPNAKGSAHSRTLRLPRVRQNRPAFSTRTGRFQRDHVHQPGTACFETVRLSQWTNGQV